MKKILAHILYWIFRTVELTFYTVFGASVVSLFCLLLFVLIQEYGLFVMIKSFFLGVAVFVAFLGSLAALASLYDWAKDNRNNET